MYASKKLGIDLNYDMCNYQFHRHFSDVSLSSQLEPTGIVTVSLSVNISQSLASATIFTS